MVKFESCIPNLVKTKSFLLKKYLFKENENSFLKVLKIELQVKFLFDPFLNLDFNLLIRTESLKNLLKQKGLLVYKKITDLLRLLFFREFFSFRMKRNYVKEFFHLKNFNLPNIYDSNLAKKSFNEIILKSTEKNRFSSNSFLVFSFNLVFYSDYFFLCSFTDILGIYFFSLKIWRFGSYTKIFLKTLKKLKSNGSKNSLEKFLILKTFFGLKKFNKQTKCSRKKIHFIGDTKLKFWKEFEFILKLISDRIFKGLTFKAFLKKKTNNSPKELFFFIEGLLFRQKKFDLVKSVKDQCWFKKNISESVRTLNVKKNSKEFFLEIYSSPNRLLKIAKIPKLKQRKFKKKIAGKFFLREKGINQKKNILHSLSKVFQNNSKYSGSLFQIILAKASIRKKNSPKYEIQLLLKNWNGDFFFTFLNIGLFFYLTENLYLKNFSFGIKFPHLLVKKLCLEAYPVLIRFIKKPSLRIIHGRKILESKTVTSSQNKNTKTFNRSFQVHSWDLGEYCLIIYFFLKNFLTYDFKIVIKIFYLVSIENSKKIQDSFFILLPFLLWKISKKAKIFMRNFWIKNDNKKNKNLTKKKYFCFLSQKSGKLCFGSFIRFDLKKFFTKPSVDEFFRRSPSNNFRGLDFKKKSLNIFKSC